MKTLVLVVGAAVTLGVGMAVSKVNETAGGAAFLILAVATLILTASAGKKK